MKSFWPSSDAPSPRGLLAFSHARTSSRNFFSDSLSSKSIFLMYSSEWPQVLNLSVEIVPEIPHPAAQNRESESHDPRDRPVQVEHLCHDHRHRGARAHHERHAGAAVNESRVERVETSWLPQPVAGAQPGSDAKAQDEAS